MGASKERLDALLEVLHRELPGFSLRYKDEDRLQRLIGRLVWPFNRHYMTVYTTVMLGRVYLPSRIFAEALGPDATYILLRHEAVHLRDARRFPVLFQLSYVLCLPVGFTMRAVWEWRGYVETLRAHHEVFGDVPEALLDAIAERFTGPDYLYMAVGRERIRRKLEAVRRLILPAA
ncbi:MAG: hypothetical protein EXR76_10320 [Myxococcales bacterium]|nr:hypothetical protein [Myxococcales bacterium]